MTPEPSLPPPQLFRSFWMGGFECSTHRNHAGERLDMIAGTQHDAQVSQDYALLQRMGIQVARDGVRWHLIEAVRGTYDWSSLLPMLEAAATQNVQVLWDLCHYGWPDWLDLFSPQFPDSFARFAEAVARVVRGVSSSVPFYAPVNEISFFSWAAARGLMYPHAEGRDASIKRQLVRAIVGAIEAIRSVDPRARFVFPEPVIHVLPLHADAATKAGARRHNESQFEAWDMVAGHCSPDLGGKPEYLDILGANFYSTNEWFDPGGRRLPWNPARPDPGWRPLHQLLADVWKRYQRPLFLAETSHVGRLRPSWIRDVGDEIYLARQQGVPVEAICLYPIIDRYDWGDAQHWHNSGMWDFSKLREGTLLRVLDQPYVSAFREVQARLAGIGCL